MEKDYIKIENLKREYRLNKDVCVQALSGLNLAIEEGELVSVVGSSGSGKSTFLNIIGGLDWDFSGEIFVAGKNIREYDENYYRRFIVGTIFQRFFLIPSLTVEENILLPTRFKRNADRKSIEERLEYILSEIAMEKRRRHYPNELSGGESQRVAIARAIIDNPKILLADEPTGNLDSTTGKSILKLLKELNQKEGITTIIVTHDMKIADETSRRITLVDGKNV